MERKTQLAIPALAIFAVTGWGWGAYQTFGRASSISPAGGDIPAVGPRLRSEARSPSISALLPTARSARLFNSLGEIAAEPKGGVNKKLMAAMRATLSDNDPTRRGRDFALLLDLMRPEDALAVHNLFLEFHREGQTMGEYGPFANRWGQIDGAGAIQALMDEKPLRLPQKDLRDIIIGWSTNDPQAALAWMKDHPDVPGSNGNFDAVIQGWINLDRDAATRYLIDHQLSMGDRVRATRNAADEILSGSGVDATVAWLTSLPLNQENNMAANIALDSIGWRLNELPYDKAANVWASLSKNSIGQIGQFERFARDSATSRQATNGSLGFFDALSTTWPVEQAASRFTTWSQQDPERVKNFLNQYADSPYIQQIRDKLAESGMDLTPAPQQSGGTDPFVGPEN
ncbi:MAG: hypothetical protein ABIS50_10820 [Luteolibacter sp.]|uniref:hypothetical protein n=1 Tax=Luteolibacter sp. TaxID=1962973 RepID=UPI00326770CA